jgi:hypothetical protein
MTPFFLALGLLMAAAPPQPANQISPVEVARRLDVTSFPNSIGPRRRPGARTLRDYGFTRIERNRPNAISLFEADSSWVFYIRVLSWSGRKGMLCIGDKAMISGTYFIIEPLEVEEGPNGLLRATGRPVTHPDCQEYSD